MAGIFGVLFPPLLFIKVAWTEAPVAVHLPSADKYVHAGMEKLPICQQLFFLSQATDRLCHAGPLGEESRSQ